MDKYCDDSYQLFIDGQWSNAEDGKTFIAYNPHTRRDVLRWRDCRR